MGAAVVLTVGDLVKAFIKNGTNGIRVRTRGKRLNYKQTTADGYKRVLTTYVLLVGSEESAQK